MSLHLVTGYAGKEHVTSADQGSFHAHLFLNGNYVLNVGKKIAATIVSNNSIKIQDGDILMQGRYIKLDSGTFIEVPIENGAQDYKRNDLIVVRYTKNASTGVESAAFVVIKGTPDTTEAVDPEYTQESILDGALVCDMPLYRVPIDGLNVGALVPLFETIDSFDVRIKSLKAENITFDDTEMGLGTTDVQGAIEGMGDVMLEVIDGVNIAHGKHISNTSNPHNVTASQVGLGNVPNVATNDQTPTYTVASATTALTSGEKLSVAFGKIAKAISSLISHLADSVSHITSTERTNWNSASTNSHTHSNKTVLDKTTASYTTAEQTKLSGIAAGAQVNTLTGVKGNAESSYRTGNVNLTPANIGAAASSHNQAASTITAGTFAGDVVAKASTAYTTAKICNHVALPESADPGEGSTSSYPNGTVIDIYAE